MFILNLSCYTSVYSSQRAQQTNGFFSNFEFVFEFLAENRRKIFKKLQGVNIDQSALCCISMDSSQQALQSNEKHFSNFNFVFKLLAENLLIFKPHEY